MEKGNWGGGRWGRRGVSIEISTAQGDLICLMFVYGAGEEVADKTMVCLSFCLLTS